MTVSVPTQLSWLTDLRIIDKSSVSVYHPRVRDDERTAVLRCAQSGVIFLAKLPDGAIEELYRKASVVASDLPSLEDSQRRVLHWHSQLEGKRVLDFGTGDGSFLDLCKPTAASVLGIELNETHRANMRGRGLDCAASLAELQDNSLDVVTMFHVLEHLVDPVGVLQEVRRVLAPEGRIIVEVPHARDFLLETLGCEEFKEFTLWSQHLVLHTRMSLGRVMAAGGFPNSDIQGWQRYGLENHLYWLARGAPGGHEQWAHLHTQALNGSYEELLATMEQTDTLVATAQTLA